MPAFKGEATFRDGLGDELRVWNDDDKTIHFSIVNHTDGSGAESVAVSLTPRDATRVLNFLAAAIERRP